MSKGKVLFVVLYLDKPAQCDNYFLLKNTNRSTTNVWQNYCDRVPNPQVNPGIVKSPDWQGTGWYRFEAPLGTTLALSDPGANHCGTAAPGYLNSPALPMNMYSTLDIKIEFNVQPWPNYHSSPNRFISGKVTNCDDFYVFWLQDTVLCNFRYCAEN